jgi:hypothetical protein
MYVHMFDEDVRHRVVPIGGFRWNRDFGVVFEAEESERSRAITLLASLNPYERNRDDEVTSEAIRSIAAHMQETGIALFEILKSTDELPSYGLTSFPSRFVFRLPGRFVQIIPSHARADAGKSFVFVPESKVWRVTIPKDLGSVRGWRRLKRGLQNCRQFPYRYQTWLEEKKLPPGVDFSEAVRMDKQFLLRRTQTWGWLGRDNSVNHQTEFFVVYRTLSFEWANATLRDHIVTKLNSLFARLGIRAAMSLRGVLTPDEILSMRDHMISGEVDFEDVLKQIYKTPED